MPAQTRQRKKTASRRHLPRTGLRKATNHTAPHTTATQEKRPRRVRGEVMIGMVMRDKHGLDWNTDLLLRPFYRGLGIRNEKRRVDDGGCFGAYDQRCDT